MLICHPIPWNWNWVLDWVSVHPACSSSFILRRYPCIGIGYWIGPELVCYVFLIPHACLPLNWKNVLDWPIAQIGQYVDFDPPPLNWNWVLDLVQVHPENTSIKIFGMCTLELESGIGLAHSWASQLILITHLGIGIGYWIWSKFIQHIWILNMVTLEFELGLGLALSLASILVWILPLDWEKGVESSSHSSSMYVSSIKILYWYS